MKVRYSIYALFIFQLIAVQSFSQIPFYPSNDKIKEFTEGLAASYPDIVMYKAMGKAANSSDSIIAIKISDNVSTTEDEPVWVFTGVIHGREKIGLRVLMDLAEELTSGYSNNSDIKNWVDAYEVWFVLNMNPYGYQFSERKNGPTTGGVDLNRNWDFRWLYGGSTNPSDSKYRGSWAASEPETQSISDLYLDRRPVFGLTFHQGNDPDGGQIMRPWNSSSIPGPPDANVLLQCAEKYADFVFASRLQGGFCELLGSGNGFSIMDPDGISCGSNESFATYCKELCWRPTMATLAAYGQSSNWCYAEAGTIDFTVEVSDRLFDHFFLYTDIGPTNSREEQILKVVTEFAKNHREAIKAWFKDFYNEADTNNFGGSGITGHVTDELTGDPLEAIIQVNGYTSDYIANRKSDSNFGRYWRLLPPGTHQVEVRANGYENCDTTLTVAANGSLTPLDIKLKPLTTGYLDLSKSSLNSHYSIYPNPVSDGRLVIKSLAEINSDYLLAITNMVGNLVMKKYINKSICNLDISSLSNGTYVLVITSKNQRFTQKLIILK